MVEIEWEEKGLVRKFSGVITTDEIDSSAIKIQASPRLDDMTYNIHDFTDVSEAQVDDEYIRFMATRAAFSLSRNPRIKLAFVGNHPVLYKMMNAFNSSGVGKHRVMHFDSMEEARQYASGTVTPSL